MISGVAVVVPAADEAHRIGRCLRSVRVALSRVSGPGRLCLSVLVLDGCTDDTETEALAADGDVTLVRVEGRCVGAARRAGTDRALALLGDLPPHEVWLASTDADGTVPGHWLTSQLRYAARGLEAIAGLVTVSDWGERSPEVARRFALYLEATGSGQGHPHVHGANLGMTALGYQRAGGWQSLCSGEDTALWRALGESGARRAHVDDVVVTTSARRDSRAPAGFAALLDDLDDGIRPEPLPALKNLLDRPVRV